MAKDFPKLQSPFKRNVFEISKEDFYKYKDKYNLRSPELYLVTPEIEEGYEWVFEDPNTIASEKLDGTNISVTIDKDGNIVSIYNRKNEVKVFNIHTTDTRFIEGIVEAINKKYFKGKVDGQFFGELIGPKLQGNPYGLDKHLWYPFDKAMASLQYKSFHKYEKTFINISSWFESYLLSLFYSRHNKINLKNTEIYAEGVVFHNSKRKEEGKTNMAKLRRDMFPWFYKEIIIHAF